MPEARIISQIFVGGALCLDLISFQLKGRKVLLVFLTASTLLLGFHFLLLQSYTAGFLALLATLRFGIAVFTTSRVVLVGLILVSAIITIFTYQGVISIIAFIGATTMTVAAYTSKDRTVRRIMMAGAVLWIIHNSILGSPAAIVLESFRLVSNIVGYWRHYHRRSKDGGSCRAHGTVRSGTSRIQVFEVEAGSLKDSSIARQVPGLEIDCSGKSYQDRKLVFFDRDSAPVEFRFIQMSEQGEIQWEVKECCNSAVAVMHVISGDEGEAELELRNAASNQKVTVRREKEGRSCIRFQVDGPAFREGFKVAPATQPFLEVWTAELSNSCLFAASDASDFESMKEQLGEFLERSCSKIEDLEERKIIVFSLRENSDECLAICQYRGELHRSLPGSAAMWLGALLSVEKGERLGEEDTFQLFHPSGVLTTRNNLRTYDTGDTRWLEFSTTAESVTNPTSESHV